ncbi:alkaline phosphatase [Marinicauda salina]|uniref:Alkaline phosphatase n=1 Tax=Marinicauda salina TaxID=2135793 RepID=A0A2U2BQV8_9PROT|nr:alkaline phosphatase D family protein [Marinicauda salina]PWE16394.1 alkaline phosphatase [Marinicauda salina]
MGKLASRALTRRFLLRSAAAGATASLAAACKLPGLERGAAFRNDPFTLGVASGDPTPEGFVLWTRLAPNPLDPDGGMAPEPLEVAWEIAADEGFSRIVRAGVERALPGRGHAVHAEIHGLPAGRAFFYRFHAGGATSPVGRATTAAPWGAALDRFRIAWCSCAHYEQGFFHAYRDMAAEAPDLIVHTGDYIYESSWGPQVRRHAVPEPYTLADYRMQHALYRLDPDLQAAAAAAPWLATWDDHEVDNDYAGDVAEEAEVSREAFRARRLAAYQAYWENMPLRRRSILERTHETMRIWGQHVFGGMAEINMTDGRQFRTPMACPTEDDRGGALIDRDCPERLDPERTYLGADQERWLNYDFGRSGARWNLVVQPTLFSKFHGTDPETGEPNAWSDGWDGYPAARRRMLDLMAERQGRGANPVLLGGDTHCYWVSDVRQDYDDPASPAIGSEFVTSSVTSHHFSHDAFAANVPNFPHIKHFDAREHGYGLMDLYADRAEVALRTVGEVKRRDGYAPRDQARFVVEAGRPGPVRA